MNQKKLFAALALVLIGTQANAKPVELDTADAHIIVVRPIDDYGVGEQKISNRQLEKFEDKTYAFAYYFGTKNDSSYVKATDDSNPIPLGVKAVVEKAGFTPNSGTMGSGGTSNSIALPRTLTPGEAKEFTQTQNALWQNKVISMGNPDKLVESAESAQTATNWMAIGGLLGGAVIGAYAGNAIGAPIGAGGGATIGGQLGISTSFLSNNKDLISFNQVPAVDYSKYKSVDVRKVTMNGFQRSGNIIIAYKGEKTEQAEQNALLAAIPALLGFNETVADIKAARAQDLSARKAVWAQYVSKQDNKEQ